MQKLIISILLIFMATIVSAEKCHIIYGATATYEPYEWVDAKGNFFGMNIDLLRAISERTNCSFEIVNYERSDMLKKLKNGEISMLSLSPTSVTDQFADYLPHSIVLYRYFFTSINSPDINSFEDLRGKTLVVIKDGFTEDYMSRVKDQYGIDVINFKDRHDVVKALSDGRADATVVTMTFMTGALKAMNIDNIKVTGSPLLPTPYGFAVNKKNKDLYNKVDKAINELKASGEYFEIIKKWSVHHETGFFSKRTILTITMLGVTVFLVIMLWNKLLYAQVQKKTKNLNEEIEIRKEIEVELIKSKSMEAKMREEAIMAGKLAALGEMATSVAHEINNPLGLIAHNVAFNNKLLGELIDHQSSASSDIKFCNMDLDDAKMQYLQSVRTTKKSIKRIQTAIDELKDFGKKHPDGHQIINIKECVFQAVKLTSYFTKKYVSGITLDITHEPAIIYGNVMHIEQILVNLIQNSCYAMNKADGIIEIKMHISDDKKYVCISVIDNGCGMDDMTLTKACEPFYTSRKSQGGTGLGLSISSRIIEEHRGRMEINSKIDVGTMINISIPLYLNGA